ncbi:MAG: DUF2063 domain-containing protein [Alphaproteobacteria bacterium]|jgi:hypothetical protein|nr:DUF2063 domain-containing protein [Alphaproteobacteria bacterium]
MLREMQKAFLAGVFGPDASDACGYIQPDRIPADRRFAIYRSNTLISLTDSLLASFPAVYRVLGDHDFRIAAARYIRKHPPAMPQLLAYGDAFPDFLDGFAPARRRGFVADLARLERARQQALFAAEAEPLAPVALQAVPVEAYAGLRFALHPTARLIASDGSDPGPDSVTGRPESVLVLRPQHGVEAHRLTPGDLALMSALGADRSLAEAAEAAAATEPAFDLQQALLGHLTRGSFSAFALPRPASDQEKRISDDDDR